MLSPDQITYHIKACARNNRESQKVIYTSFYSYAMAICERYSDNNEDAVEILNEGFLNIFKKINHYKLFYTNLAGSFRGWLHENMVNSAIDYFRKNYRPQKAVDPDTSIYPIAGELSNEKEELTHKAMIQALRDLSPCYRIIFNLHVIDGMDHEAIAEKLNISSDTSKLSLWKAKKQLEKLLFITQTTSPGIAG